MRALVLAAGQGTRLLPLTASRPKCLVPLRGRPLLERQLDALRTAGVHDIAIVAGYQADAIRAAANGCPVFLNEAYATTNMVASLFAARPWLAAGGDVVVAYGDIVFEPRLVGALIEAHGEISVIVDELWRTYWEARMADPLADAETLRIGADGRIAEIGARPRRLDEIEAQYIGLFRLTAAAIPRIITFYDGLAPASVFRGRPVERLYMTDFLQMLIHAGFDVTAVRQRAGWLEIDTAADLALYERLAATGTLDRFCHLT